MNHYLWEIRPYFRQVAGQLVLGSISGIVMNTMIVLPAILLGRAIDTVLALGDASMPPDAVRQAAAIAGADSFIMALPRGHDTVLGSRRQLSAGQRQLLTLARALVWDPRVLLLDEATAAIDSASEAAFRDALRTALAGHGRAVLSIAHRLSTAREADRVVVMEEGRIVEEGPAEELMRRGGWFAAMLELEEAGWQWRDGGNSDG